MIQRIQSVYLLLAAASFAIAAHLDWVLYASADSVVSFMEAENGQFVYWLCLITAIDTLTTIFMFNNRQVQQMVVKFAMLSGVLSLGAFGVVHYLAMNDGSMPADLNLTYDLAFPLASAAMVLLWLASRAIKKDDDLVKSVDRLR